MNQMIEWHISITNWAIYVFLFSSSFSTRLQRIQNKQWNNFYFRTGHFIAVVFAQRKKKITEKQKKNHFLLKRKFHSGKMNSICSSPLLFFLLLLSVRMECSRAQNACRAYFSLFLSRHCVNFVFVCLFGVGRFICSLFSLHFFFLFHSIQTIFVPVFSIVSSYCSHVREQIIIAFFTLCQQRNDEGGGGRFHWINQQTERKENKEWKHALVWFRVASADDEDAVIVVMVKKTTDNFHFSFSKVRIHFDNINLSCCKTVVFLGFLCLLQLK